MERFGTAVTFSIVAEIVKCHSPQQSVWIALTKENMKVTTTLWISLFVVEPVIVVIPLLG